MLRTVLRQSARRVGVSATQRFALATVSTNKLVLLEKKTPT